MNKPLRYVLIGVGGFAHWWRTAFLPHIHELGLAEAVGAVDIDEKILPDAKESLNLTDDQLYTDADKCLAETKPDFIVIVVPPAFHEQMVDCAVAHGCHILSEKPIADTMEASVRIYKKVQAAGLKMAVTMSHRFDQDKQTLESEIKSGKYGALNYVVQRFTHNCRGFASWGKFRHEIPDPLLVEGTVHHFDIHRALSGSNAKTVYARTWNPSWGEYAGDSTGLIVIEMENGVRCLYEGAKANATTLNGWGNDYLRAECEKATLELDGRRLRMITDLEGERNEQEIPLKEQDAWMNAWLAELFCRWVLGGDAPPNTLEDNIHCTALLFAAIESAHSGKVVDVPAFLEKHMHP